MPRDAIFYPDPQPFQRPPYAPIPPPVVSVMPAYYRPDLAIIRQAWEPPAPQPVQLPSNIVALTLNYGQQPPPGPRPALVNQHVVRTSWEPPPPEPRQLPLTFAPLTLKYGQQPPIGPMPGLVNQILARMAWEPPPPMPAQRAPGVYAVWSVDNLVTGTPQALGIYPQVIRVMWEPPPPMPPGPVFFVPLTLPTGQQPPTYSIVNQVVVRTAWEPPDPAPWQKPSAIVTLSLPTGQQPPRWSFVTQYLVRQMWEPPWTGAQNPPPGAAEAFAPPVVNVPPPYSIVNVMTVRQAWEPPPPMPPRDPENIVPLTLTYGQQPPPGPQPAFVGQAVMRQAWEPPPPMPQQPPGYIVAQTLVYGQQPPPWSIVNQTVLRASWEPPWLPLPSLPLNLPVSGVTVLTLVWGNRVHETGFANGTGNVTLKGKAFNKRPFKRQTPDVPNNGVLFVGDYAIAMIASTKKDPLWEFSLVQMQADGTLKRVGQVGDSTKPYSSSNMGAFENFDGQDCDVFIDSPVEVVYTAFVAPGYTAVVR